MRAAPTATSWRATRRRARCRAEPASQRPPRADHAGVGVGVGVGMPEPPVGGAGGAGPAGGVVELPGGGTGGPTVVANFASTRPDESLAETATSRASANAFALTTTVIVRSPALLDVVPVGNTVPYAQAVSSSVSAFETASSAARFCAAT